ncbi:metal-dependent hydrolase [Halosolutus gelatinilyticus]|uniref:metal-dependent hydrolase n=1 Tax=Halosolutus gelatinilyticus TaxID=2931975 RepID=UPI001FF42F52|nr:metal-dependent hydrolase [Halosolutus gelatinilyticus]
MFPLGHLAIGYLCYSLSTRVRSRTPPADGPALVVLVASLSPDLIDKPLAWYLGLLPSGRSLGHSALVIVLFSIGLYLLTRPSGHGEYAIAVAIGGLSHSLLDIAPLLWDPTASEPFLLWPLAAVPIPAVLAASHPPLGGLYFLSEVGFASLALVAWRRDGYPGLALVRAGVVRARRPTS